MPLRAGRRRDRIFLGLLKKLLWKPAIETKQNKTKELFKTSVRKCLSREVLTANCIRSFSRWACQYILAYHALNLQRQQQASGEADNIVSTLQNEAQITPAKIEHMVKEFQIHHCAMDFDEEGGSTTIVLIFVYYYYYYF